MDGHICMNKQVHLHKKLKTIYLKDWCRQTSDPTTPFKTSSDTHFVDKQQGDGFLALLRVVLSAGPGSHFLWRRGDEEKTWVAFGRLFVIIWVAPLSLAHRGASIVRVGVLVLWSRGLVAKPASRAMLAPGGLEASPSPSRVATSVASPVSGADAGHVGPFG